MQQELDKLKWSDMDLHKALVKFTGGKVSDTRESKYGKYKVIKYSSYLDDDFRREVILVSDKGYIKVGFTFIESYTIVSQNRFGGVMWPVVWPNVATEVVLYPTVNDALNFIIETAEKRMDTLMREAYSWFGDDSNG